MAQKPVDIENKRIPILGSPLNRGTDESKDQRFVNAWFWALKNPVTGKPTYYFVKRAGLLADTQPPGAAATGRGAYSWNGIKYSVFGNKIYSGTTDLGVTLAGSTGLVGFAETRPGAATQYLGVNDGTALYLISATDDVIVLNNKAITSSSVANPTVITCTGHGLETGNQIIIRNHTGSTPSINDTIYTITKTGADTFTIPVNVTVGGTGGTIGVFPATNTTDLVYIDGYWTTMKSDGTVWNCSVDDPTEWPADAFLTAQMYEGTGIGLGRQANFLLVISSNSTQAFFNNANATGSPFSNYESGAAQIGCTSHGSIVFDEADILWVGNSGTGGHSVWLLTGLTDPKEVAQAPQKLLLDAEGSDIVNCVGYMERIAGKKLYILQLTSRTLVYDLELEIWTEFEGTDNGKFPISAFFEHQHQPFVQHSTNGKIYKWSPTTYQDDSTNFTVLARFGRVDFDTMQRKFPQRYEFIGDKQASTANITFEYSDDDYVTMIGARTIDMSQTRPYCTTTKSFRRRAHQITYTGNGPLRMEAIEIFYRLGM